MAKKINVEKAKRQIAELRKNPPKVTAAHHAEAKRLLKQNQDFEDAKDRSIENERKAFSKDLASWTYNQISGVGKLFHGFGAGKKHACSLCGQHESQMHNTNDGKWYCSEHRWFGNLTKEKQEKERLCLNSKE